LANGFNVSERIGLLDKQTSKSSNKTITLYHASDQIRKVEDIIFPGPRNNCEFGVGFYLAESKQTAEEWVIGRTNPTINVYNFDIPSTSVLYLTGRDWVRVVVGFRKKQYKINFKSHIICGIIANDRMDESLSTFLDGEIGDLRLLKCLDYCKLGNQYLLRKPISDLKYVKHYALKGLEY